MITTEQSTTTSPSVAASNSLFDLPQELQDDVFKLTYPRAEKIKLVMKAELEKREEDRQFRTGEAIFPFPTMKLKVDEWMVSKRYFIAARAWIGVQDAKSWEKTCHFLRVWNGANPVADRVTLIYAFAKEASINPDSFNSLPLKIEQHERISPCLKSLTVGLARETLGLMYRITSRCLDNDLSHAALKKIIERYGLDCLRGLADSRANLRAGIEERIWLVPWEVSLGMYAVKRAMRSSSLRSRIHHALSLV